MATPDSPRWLSYRQAAGRNDRYLHLAEKWGVSEVARSRAGAAQKGVLRTVDKVAIEEVRA